MAAATVAACAVEKRPPPIDDQIAHPLPFGGGGAAALDAGADADAGGPTLVASAQLRPVALTVSSSFLYWANGGASTSDGSVVRAPRLGGAAVLLAAQLAAPRDLALHGNDLFVAEGGAGPAGSATGAILRIGPLDPAPVPFATAQDAPTGLAVEDDGLYWSAGAGAGISVLRAPFDGGAIASLTDIAGTYEPGPVALDGASIYVLARGRDAGGIFRAPRAGGASETLWLASRGQPADMVLAGTTLYWVVDDAAPYGAIHSISVGTGSPSAAVVDVVTGLDHPAHIAVDASQIYWTSLGSGGSVGALSRTATDAGAAVLLARDLGAVGPLAVSDVVYVANDAAVYAVPK